MTASSIHRTTRTMPAILVGLAVVLLLMAVTSLVRTASRLGSYGRLFSSQGAYALGTFLLGVGLAVALALVAWYRPQVQVDENGVEERSPKGVRTLKWDEITKVTSDRKGGQGVMRLYRGSESWAINFLAFAKPEQVVSLVTSRLPRTVTPTTPEA
jgi:hypothetical protein